MRKTSFTNSDGEEWAYRAGKKYLFLSRIKTLEKFFIPISYFPDRDKIYPETVQKLIVDGLGLKTKDNPSVLFPLELVHRCDTPYWVERMWFEDRTSDNRLIEDNALFLRLL